MVQRINPGVRYSQAVIHGPMVYTAGIVARDSSKGIAEQTQDVLDQLEALLKQCGTSKKNLVTANIWLPNIADFDAMNAVWDKWIDPDGKPARATVEARLADPRLLIEIQVTAAI